MGLVDGDQGERDMRDCRGELGKVEAFGREEEKVDSPVPGICDDSFPEGAGKGCGKGVGLQSKGPGSA